MSRSRLKAKVRKNVDYIEATRMLDACGLGYALYQPPGKGQHPRLVIEAPSGTVEFVVACTPGPRVKAARVRNQLRKVLAAGGVEV